MSEWVVLDESGFSSKTRSVIGPFESMDAAYKWCDEENRDMQDTTVKSMRDPNQ